MTANWTDFGSEETDQTRVEGPSGDLPPVYDEDGTELRRYPAPQHASLYDPSHIHDADRDAVIIHNPDLEPDSFNDIQFFRTLRARGRGYHPRTTSQQQSYQGGSQGGFQRAYQGGYQGDYQGDYQGGYQHRTRRQLQDEQQVGSGAW